MLKTWRYHAWAVGLLAVVGTLSLIQLMALFLPDVPFWVEERVPGTLGTRFFGYGALALLGTALAIGPLARLRPRPFARLVLYRRAMGIWSALAGGVHLLFVLQLVSYEFYKKTWLTLFLHPYVSYNVDSTRMVNYRLDTTMPLTVVAWTGLFALLLLLVIALVSNDWSQRFLGQATWKLIQQWSYTAFLFVTLHVLTMRYGGKLKLSPPLARWATWLLLAVALLQMAGFLYTVWRRRSTRGGSENAA